MPPATSRAEGGHFRALMRIAPYLWPKGEVELRLRVVAALVLVAVYLAANRFKPEAEVMVPVRRAGRGRARS